MQPPHLPTTTGHRMLLTLTGLYLLSLTVCAQPGKAIDHG
jgi:hypothetical protein